MFLSPAELPHGIFISKQVPVYFPPANISATILDTLTCMSISSAAPSSTQDTDEYV